MMKRSLRILTDKRFHRRVQEIARARGKKRRVTSTLGEESVFLTSTLKKPNETLLNTAIIHFFKRISKGDLKALKALERVSLESNNKNDFGRMAAMKVFARLAKRGKTYILPQLIKGTKDPSQLVRYNATVGLGHLAIMGEVKTFKGLIRGFVGHSGFVYGPARGGLETLIKYKVPVIKHLAGLYMRVNTPYVKERIIRFLKDQASSGNEDAIEFLTKSNLGKNLLLG